MESRLLLVTDLYCPRKSQQKSFCHDCLVRWLASSTMPTLIITDSHSSCESNRTNDHQCKTFFFSFLFISSRNSSCQGTPPLYYGFKNWKRSKLSHIDKCMYLCAHMHKHVWMCGCMRVHMFVCASDNEKGKEAGRRIECMMLFIYYKIFVWPRSFFFPV